MTRPPLLLVESNTSGTGPLFVRAARELGFAPVLVTARPGRYPYLAAGDAPEVAVLPAVTEEAVFALVRARYPGLAGVTSSSESWVATAAALAARLGLPGADAARVRAARDKSVQREVLAAAGLPVPAFRAVASAPDAVLAARALGLPVVVKPVDGTGSAGVRLCATPAEVGRHAATLLTRAAGQGSARRLLVEARVDGPEFSVEVFSGRVVGITRKHLASPPWFVEAGHDYPAAVSARVARALADTATRGSAALGLGWGPLHWELRVAGGRAYAIEVNPRLAGGFIPELVRHAHGIDLVRETLRLVVGAAPDLEPEVRRHASLRFLFAPAAGRLVAVDGVDAARAVRGVVDVALYRQPGDELAPHHDFRDRVGHVIARADRPGDARAAAGRARDAIRLRVDPAAGDRIAVRIAGVAPLAGAAEGGAR